MASQPAVGGITGFPIAGGMPLTAKRARLLGTLTQQFQNPNTQWVIGTFGAQAPEGLGNR